MAGDDWTEMEVEAVVADYLDMLTLELLGQSFNKTHHRHQLKAKLNDRSEGAIEFKHCNISVALIDLGFPYLRGYQPRSNYQTRVAQILLLQIREKLILDQAALASVQQPAVLPMLTDFAKVKSDAPIRRTEVQEKVLPEFRAVKRDYLEREGRNRSLGLAGEEFVVRFERWRLNSLGESCLADRVEHVSNSRGDGLGYDVLSFDGDGKERFIEVKTTTYGRSTPFFISSGELAFSRVNQAQFHLYRLFEFRDSPRLFDLQGPLEQHLFFDPIAYRASFF